MTSLRIVIRGRVQGLGFRPHVFRLARRLGVTGSVVNTGEGVVILAQGRRARAFLEQLKARPPALAHITSFVVTTVGTERFDSFRVEASRPDRRAGVEVLPDLAVCADCRREVFARSDRRFGYPFTNCTQCGPRYTIIERLPYDRPRTTMWGFAMCPDCGREYSDPSDRRFHAQPNACPGCGPQLRLLNRNGQPVAGAPFEGAVAALARGRVVAIRSLGGFQLACDATDDAAVRRLRRLKHRPTKPLALMCADLAVVLRFCRLSRHGRSLLVSRAAPIVLLARKRRPAVSISPAIAPGNSTFGVMLAYTPLHALLFRRLRKLTGRPAVLVMTSANLRDDPITASDQELLKELPGVADFALTHDRPIANRCDDSVVLPDPLPGLVRRARGYAPQPVVLGPMFHVKRPVLAVGAEWKNCFSLAMGDRVFLSPHIGSMATSRGSEFWLETLRRFQVWTGIKPRVIACDLHPDYLSTRLAERLAAELRLPLVRVQHHAAHLLSVMAEHGLSGPVLGLACDGTGYGTDGAIWGCELLEVQPDLSWVRAGHLKYQRLAAAGAEVADPARAAATYLSLAGEDCARLWLRLPEVVSERGSLTSSLGRLFDAVAGITGICRRATFDGEAAIALESAAKPEERRHYPFEGLLDLSVSPAIVDPLPLIRDVSRETLAGVSPAVVSARFHNTLVLALGRLATDVARARGIGTVCLSGGSFQNRLLLRGVIRRLESAGLRAYWNQVVPLNDGGLALGQAVAASR